MFNRVKRKKPDTPHAKQVKFQRETGQSLVEMALVTPLLLLFLIGVFEVGWAIRGYIVLVNANREATRFAARGQYLDFSLADPATVGYGYVLTHTLTTIAQELPFDVLSEDPNGTLIVSHYLVDTGKPCADPPCAPSEEACRDPAQREADYAYDDLILHPGREGYDFFSASYGIERPSRLDADQWATRLKEENDAFNCVLNLKDSGADWSVNSVIMVESFYDQPQLLGMPFISNRFTDPVPFYTHTVMRVSSSARSSGANTGPTGGGSPRDGQGCELFPIAVHEDALNGLSPGTPTGNIRNGAGSGNFGWLRWTDDTDFTSNSNSEPYLAEEMNNMRMSVNDYREPEHKDPAADTVINLGDWVWGLTGNVNSNGVAKGALQARLGQTLRFPVWNITEGSGSNTVYHIVRFAWITLNGYKLTGNPKEVWGTFMGWDDYGCPGNGH